MKPATVITRRGDVVDSTHVCHAVVVDAHGATVAEWGLPDTTVLTRSAAKPFQVLPALRAGVMTAHGFGATELAAMCSSHNSEQFQVDVIQAMAARIGFGEDALVCAPHRPLIRDLGHHLPNDTAAVTMAPKGAFASNCSGKHTAMIALALATGEDPGGYHELDHPVQIACRDAVAEMCRVGVTDLHASVDGCGVICWALPLRAVAVGYAGLASSRDAPVRQVAEAMTTRPDFVAGHRRLCTALMQHTGGRILAKIGAGGVYGAAHLERGWGIALKIADGNTLASGVALIGLLDALDPTLQLASALPAYAEPAILNTRRDVVGHFSMGERFSLD